MAAPQRFRPIALWSTMQKLIAKAINRTREVVAQAVAHPNQREVCHRRPDG